MQNVKAIRVQPLTTAREYLYSMTKEATKNRENELNFSRNASSIIFWIGDEARLSSIIIAEWEV